MRPFVLLLLSCAAAHAAGRPVLAVSEVHGDACDTVHAVIEVRARARERRIEVWLDDRPVEVTVPARAERVEVTLVPGTWQATHQVRASWRWVDTDPVTVPMPPWSLGLVTTLPEDPALDEHDPVKVSIGGACPVPPGRFVVIARDGERGFANVAVEGPELAFPLDLAQGPHAVRIELWDAATLVAADTVRTTVGPPCVDEDGDGHLLCHRQDCDDHDATVHPGAEDVIGDGIDQDCDGRNGKDRDTDGFEDRAVGGDDCDDREPSAHPGPVVFPDADGDGASPMKARDLDCDGVPDTPKGAWDCNDADAHVPSEEAPDPTGVDEDCDGLVDEGTVVFDDDGDGLAEVDGDCDDDDTSIRPGRRELADCRDQDCDGEVDEGVVRPARDDGYEPDDEHSAELPGAWYGHGLFGGSYRSSSARVATVTRDLTDAERFSVWAHDGGFDNFYVSVEVVSIGDDRTYQITVRDDRGGVRSTGTVSRRAGTVSFGGKTGRDDTGTYYIDVEPITGDLPWCPLVLTVSTG